MYYIAKGTLFNTPGITYLGKESQKKWTYVYVLL